MKLVTIHTSDQQSKANEERLLEFVKSAILRTSDIETTVSLSSLPVTKGVSIILFDFNVSPLMAVSITTAVKIAAFIALETKVKPVDIQITMHSVLSV